MGLVVVGTFERTGQGRRPRKGNHGEKSQRAHEESTLFVAAINVHGA
jgi:hypothetical protein